MRVRQPSAFFFRKQDVTNPVYSNTTANCIIQFRVTTARTSSYVQCKFKFPNENKRKRPYIMPHIARHSCDPIALPAATGGMF